MLNFYSKYLCKLCTYFLKLNYLIIVIIKAAIYSRGEIFLSVARITRRIVDNMRRAGESHLEYREQLQETPI